MAEALKKKEVLSTTRADLFSKSSTTTVEDSLSDEIVIGLCGPIGAPIHDVARHFEQILKDKYDYNTSIIRLSDLINKFSSPKPSSGEHDRRVALIDAGNLLRRDYGPSVLADLAISEIALERENAKQSAGSSSYQPRRRVCHIIDSVKNNEEYEALRRVYRDMFYFVGVYSPVPMRVKNLTNLGMGLDEVYKLIDRDSGEETGFGQSVRNTLPLADFFLRVDTDSARPTLLKIERFLALVFGTDIVTPTHGETAMYAATSAAGNSACLSRQVGASLTDKDGNVLALGWNDVPKSGGGLYQTSMTDPLGDKDKRCMNVEGGKCFNDSEKDLIAEEITKALIKAELLDGAQKRAVIDVIKESKVKDLIEFSRAVHAEMHALISASQAAGDRVRGGRLYCTTYPCHSCARHLIMAGIVEIFYVEPYRKSLATKLHSDAITEVESESDKVRILPFDGVAPARYLELFKVEANSRKRDGKRVTKELKQAIPISEVTLESLPALEGIVVKTLIDKQLLKRPDSSVDKDPAPTSA